MDALSLFVCQFCHVYVPGVRLGKIGIRERTKTHFRVQRGETIKANTEGGREKRKD